MTDRNVNNYVFAVLLFLFLLSQLSLFPQLFYGKVVPDLVQILLITASLFYKSSDVFYISFFSGLALDVFSSAPFGTITISLLLSVFVSSYLSHCFLKKLFSLNLFLIPLASIAVYNVIYFVLMNVGGFQQISSGDVDRLLTVIAFEGVYIVLLIYPLAYVLLRR